MFINTLILNSTMEEDEGHGQGEAKFNMGIATLERIHISLEKIRWCCENLAGITKQNYHINQIKILFMNVTPLLGKEEVAKYSKEVDGLKIRSKVSRGRHVNYYDYKQEARLFEIVREWTITLNKFFMPKKSDFTGL